jgi:serine/threonine protein kinase
VALTPGIRLGGPYDIAAQIGVGGMGEVYRATDTNVKRAVAIKVLSASVAADAERLARPPTRGRSPRLAQPSEYRGGLRSGIVAAIPKQFAEALDAVLTTPRTT